MPSFHTYVQFFPGDYEQDWVEDAPSSDSAGLGAWLADGYAPAPLDTRLILPGGASDYAKTPDDPKFNLVNADISVRVSADAWHPTANSDFYLVSKSAGAGQISWALRRGQNGFLEFVNSVDGTAFSTPTSTTKVPAPDASAIWVRVARTDSTGSTSFFTAPDQIAEPSVWTSLTANRTSTAGAPFDSTAEVEVGASGGVATEPGLIYRVIIKSSGVIVADFDPRDWQGGTSWVSSTGETWTLNGAASVAPRLQPVGAYWGAKVARVA